MGGRKKNLIKKKLNFILIREMDIERDIDFFLSKTCINHKKNIKPEKAQ